MGAVAYSWRQFYKVHPSAEKFDLLATDELKALAKDIEKNGLKVPIQTRRVGSHSLKRGGWRETFVIDGRNRLDAMEKLGWKLVNEKGQWIGVALGSASGGRRTLVEHKDVPTHKEVALEIIGFNVRRRHLSKEQQVDLIDEALRASRHGGEMPSKPRWTKGVPGSAKDEHKTEVVEQASKEGIAKRTVERVLARKKLDGAKPKPQRRKHQPEVPDDPTSHSYVDTRLKKFLEHWPPTQWRLVTARIAQCLLSRPISKVDASGRRAYGTGETLPVSITYATPVVIESDLKTDKMTSGETLNMADLFKDW